MGLGSLGDSPAGLRYGWTSWCRRFLATSTRYRRSRTIANQVGPVGRNKEFQVPKSGGFGTETETYKAIVGGNSLIQAVSSLV